MIRSMTGFASARGELAPFAWVWDLRSVNGKGLDVRLRLPDYLEGFDALARADLTQAISRGNVTLSLRLNRSDDLAAAALNLPMLDAALSALAEIEYHAMERGITLAPSRASDLLALRGMLDGGAAQDDLAGLMKRLRADLGPLIAAFVATRDAEGAALAAVLGAQIDRIEALTAQAATLAEARRDSTAATLRANLARVMDAAAGADPDRVAQELALLAVKGDVTEEIDRLGAHVAAARDLLGEPGPVGRRFDFLMQEFNREANTLCSKSQNTDLTAVGLELKALIDQMREQVQNVE